MSIGGAVSVLQLWRDAVTKGQADRPFLQRSPQLT